MRSLWQAQVLCLLVILVIPAAFLPLVGVTADGTANRTVERPVESPKTTASTTTINPSDDATVESQKPDTCQGSGTLLKVGAFNDEYDAEYKMRSYLKFSVSGVPADASITSAKIYLYLSSGWFNSRVINAHRTTSDSWNENTVTWNSAPGYSPTQSASVTVGTTVKWYSWDVTTAAKNALAGTKVFTMCFRDKYDESPPAYPDVWLKCFKSDENTQYRPYLKVEYTIPPPVTVSVTTPDSVDVSEFTVIVTASRQADITIYVNNEPKETGTGTLLTYDVPYEGVRLCEIRAVASTPSSTAEETKHTMVRWEHPSGGEQWGTDGARHPDDLTVRKVADKILQYGISQLNRASARNDKEAAIRSLCDFAMVVFDDEQWVVGEDALTDVQVAEYFMAFNPVSTDPVVYEPGRNFDCRDMAAFITGIVRSLGLGARMISVEFGSAVHVTAEVRGAPAQYGGDWFLIDPRKPFLVTGDSSASDVYNAYSNPADEQKRFHVIWGFDSTGWGSGVLEKYQQTAWTKIEWDPLAGEYVRVYADPPAGCWYYYSSNPYDIIVESPYNTPPPP